ncbi:YolD-like family protein [Bacillus sp. ISL-46]|uniref:YolD-like family protein n=2 Tax=Bacillus TaxID=1386 RepID=UPI001BE7F7B5|nr:YolD-like family protein [Bacillus sp. ISL-46]MBT2722702.1 YolD-like family protein [Bacillus sp. ISL-46]
MNKDHKDRGMKKWNGFFMPETIKMLKDLWEDDHKTPRPHLDKTKIEEMERLLFEGMATKKLLEITTWTNGFFTSRVGFVTKIDPLKKKIQIQDELRSTINLDFFSLTNVMVK